MRKIMPKNLYLTYKENEIRFCELNKDRTKMRLVTDPSEEIYDLENQDPKTYVYNSNTRVSSLKTPYAFVRVLDTVPNEKKQKLHLSSLNEEFKNVKSPLKGEMNFDNVEIDKLPFEPCYIICSFTERLKLLDNVKLDVEKISAITVLLDEICGYNWFDEDFVNNNLNTSLDINQIKQLENSFDKILNTDYENHMYFFDDFEYIPQFLNKNENSDEDDMVR